MSEEPNELNLAFADMKFGERLAKLQWMTHNRQFTPEQWVELGDTIASFYDCIEMLKQKESQLQEAVEVLRQIDAEWCKHPSIPELKEHRQWCVDCQEWLYLHTTNPAREFLERYKHEKSTT